MLELAPLSTTHANFFPPTVSGTKTRMLPSVLVTVALSVTLWPADWLLDASAEGGEAGAEVEVVALSVGAVTSSEPQLLLHAAAEAMRTMAEAARTRLGVRS